MTDAPTRTPAEIADALEAMAFDWFGVERGAPWLAQLIDRTRADLAAAAKSLRVMDEALARLEPKAPNGSARIWFGALTKFADDRVFVCSPGDVWEWSVTMGDLRAARRARGQ